MTSGLLELTIIIAIATVLGIVARILKQPVILAYLFTGVLIGIFKFLNIGDREIFGTFSELGVMFLLFLIGLEINYTSLRLVGKVSLIAGIAQIVFTFIVGFLIAIFFNFSYLQSAYISIALTFSSTIIVVKLLSEKKDLNSLYGKITVGFLLVQDFFAILLLVILGGVAVGKGLVLNDVVFALGKGIALIFVMFWLGRKILPAIFDKIARSQELLFMASVAWCLGVATLVLKAGFSIEIGGFLAGLALANSAEHFQISTRIRSLRDFFIMVFFVILGSSLTFSNFSGITWPIIVFSLFVLIGNPLIVLIIMGAMGYRKRTSFLCGVTVAQISEFSLILAALGYRLGHITEGVVSLITAVGIITIILSTYLILFGDEVYKYLKNVLIFFERKNRKEEDGMPVEFDKPIILIGCHRVGQNIAANLPKEEILINDFDPNVISQMRRQGYTTLFGDIADPDILEKANFKNARLIISTSPKFEDNLSILNEINLKSSTDAEPKKPKVILRAENEEDAELFYEKGADYVLLPHFTSGQYLGRSISIDPDLKILEQLRKKDLELIEKIKQQNQKE